MKALFLSIIFLSLAAPAFAGGLKCQVNGTCQCQYDGTCDELGNPTPPRPVITCGNGESASRVFLGKRFEEMPSEGQVYARFQNVALPIHDYVTTSIHPVSHARVIEFSTAYCGYHINIGSRQGQYYVLDSSLECEGNVRVIQCELR